ncbi:DUF2116 family Zn-ribbon domain-containing protein [Pedobacter puniceum]|uniref:DUF2116 family Zn-ribbon domain-containing protein n=1 Tax=Pedobacter puniceum TaxID=2666136 RepID=A0A7K0FS42_9SPHI|nr:DUF2116 family Zn-ribbon domain-containing protein [Pedobacter puniceum]MRX48814.1 DUF2116 family Zn-ribbon domain-containing protein [Pedobacter puniceum]
MSKNCLDCGLPVIGRIDKKFCDDQCRSNYNNKIKNQNNSLIKSVNAILLRNRKILEKLNPEGKTKTTLEKLQKEGFNFSYHTHQFTTQKGSVYTFCYDYGYLPLENHWFLLVRKVE